MDPEPNWIRRYLATLCIQIRIRKGEKTGLPDKSSELSSRAIILVLVQKRFSHFFKIYAKFEDPDPVSMYLDTQHWQQPYHWTEPPHLHAVSIVNKIYNVCIQVQCICVRNQYDWKAFSWGWNAPREYGIPHARKGRRQHFVFLLFFLTFGGGDKEGKPVSDKISIGLAVKFLDRTFVLPCSCRSALDLFQS